MGFSNILKLVFFYLCPLFFYIFPIIIIFYYSCFIRYLDIQEGSYNPKFGQTLIMSQLPFSYSVIPFSYKIWNWGIRVFYKLLFHLLIYPICIMTGLS
jgi:hypothetical protein